MSLYQLQKFLFDINRNLYLQTRFREDRRAVLAAYQLSNDEREAVASGNIGLIYVLGANGQLLMHFAAFLGLEWSAYISAMREGIKQYGPVRAGIYHMTTRLDQKVADI